MNIDSGRQSRAAGCYVTLEDSFVSMKEEGVAAKFRSLFSQNLIKVFYVTLKLKVVSSSGTSHYVFIQLEPDFTSSAWAGNRVKVYCDCADFMYRSAYILNKRDSLFTNAWTKTALGQALTNAPTGNKGTTTLCKHAYAALNWLMANYQTVMSSL